MSNPYHPLTPPDDPTLFFGRQDAVAFLRQRFVGGNNLDLAVIIGRRGMGKTALLHHIPFIVDERYQVAYCDLATQAPLTEAGVLSLLAESIMLMMERIGASTYRIPPRPDRDGPELRRWFAEEFLDVALTAIRRDRFLLLLLDNWEAIFQAIENQTLPDDFTGYLSGLLAQHERLDVLVALDIMAETRALSDLLTANPNAYFRLAHLDDSTARQLITEPVAEHYTYSDESIAEILRLCGGYPFLIHSVCRLIYRYREGSTALSVISPSMVQAVYLAALEETGEILQDIWDNAAPNNLGTALKTLLDFHQAEPQRPISLGELREKTPLNPTQLVAKLRELEYLGLIKTTADGHHLFTTLLEANWLAEHRQKESPSQEWRLRSINWAAMVGIALVLLIVAALFVLGIFDSADETRPSQDAPPTSTFVLDMDATRRIDAQVATARADQAATDEP